MPPYETDEWNVSDRFMLDVVERCFEDRDYATIYALLGEKDPPTDVARALCRALDSGLEVRDLAEAGLTYIRTADNPLPTTQEKIKVAANEEDMGLDEVGALADEGNEDAIAALKEFADGLDIDADDHADKTWAEFAEFLDEANGGEEKAEAEEVEAEEAVAESNGTGHGAEELEDMDMAELRLLAKAAGVEEYAKARRATLIREVLEGAKPGASAKASITSTPTSAAEDDLSDEISFAFKTIVRFIKSL